MGNGIGCNFACCTHFTPSIHYSFLFIHFTFNFSRFIVLGPTAKLEHPNEFSRNVAEHWWPSNTHTHTNPSTFERSKPCAESIARKRVPLINITTHKRINSIHCVFGNQHIGFVIYWIHRFGNSFICFLCVDSWARDSPRAAFFPHDLNPHCNGIIESFIILCRIPSQGSSKNILIHDLIQILPYHFNETIPTKFDGNIVIMTSENVPAHFSWMSSGRLEASCYDSAV